MKTFRRILLGTDFSPASMEAVEQALKVAKASGAQLLIANACVEPGPMEMSYARANAYEQWKHETRAEAERRLQPLVERARAEGLDARALVLEGFPDEALIEAARQEAADLVVVGTNGRTGAERFLLGSVAWRVVAASECPVMTVRAQHGLPEAAGGDAGSARLSAPR